MPTTLQIALLAGLLGLLSNLAVIGFIYWRTHDEAVSTVGRQVVEQGKVLSDVYRTGGKTALDDAIQDTMSYADPQTAVALFGRDGRLVMGNLAALPSTTEPMPEGYRNGLIRLRGQTTPHEGAIVTQRFANGQLLVSGRIFGEGLALRETLESSLFIGLASPACWAWLCGLILAHYVGRRVAGISEVADRISARDLSQRIPLTGGGDAFDQLGARSTRCSTASARLMEELRLLTDSLAHDLRSPVSRLRSAAHAAAETSDPKEQEELLGASSASRFADADPDLGAGDQPVGSADRPQPVRLVRCRRAVGRADRDVRAAGRGTRGGAEVRAARPRDAAVRPSPIAGAGDQQPRRNAIRYGSAGGEIRVGVRPSEGAVRIEVADRGPGIPEALRGEALRRFGRLNSSRSDEGAGLGLALAEAITHLHNGKLLLEDNHPGLLTALALPVHADRG